MAAVRCRQCGTVTELPDYHGVVTIVCDVCRWRECYPARRRIAQELQHDAAAAFEAHQRHETLVADTFERLHELSPHAFEGFCGRLFELLGHTVTPADPQRAQSYALELREGNVVTYVACKRALGHESVSLEELENLVGVMRHDGVHHGIFVTTGSFAEACREPADEASVELIDGEGLRQRMDSVDISAIEV